MEHAAIDLPFVHSLDGIFGGRNIGVDDVGRSIVVLRACP